MLGAIVLGAYTDRHGRRAGLLLTLMLMSIGIFSIACMPAYAMVGVLAPILVLLGRLLQGFSAGMELGGVSVYLAEIATPGHKGFYVGWQSSGRIRNPAPNVMSDNIRDENALLLGKNACPIAAA